MPGGDGTGPIGMGPMTGGGRGHCAVSVGRTRNRTFAGRSFGGGRRRGCAGLPTWMRFNQMQAEEELETLKAYAGDMKQELANIEERIETLQKSK
ncbi:MAG: DUF5320 domain-containing protein [Candidatus Omnitrophota bacterium]